MPSLHHTGLTVADLDASIRFWRDAVGMTVLFEQVKAGGYLEAITGEPGAHVRMAHLAFDPDGPRIELFQYVAPRAGKHVQRPADVGFTHVCVACEDIDAAYARLTAAGAAPFGPVISVDTGANRGGRGVYLRDPDGHVVGLFQRPPA